MDVPYGAWLDVTLVLCVRRPVMRLVRDGQQSDVQAMKSVNVSPWLLIHELVAGMK